jgi:hypothetical protein
MNPTTSTFRSSFPLRAEEEAQASEPQRAPVGHVGETRVTTTTPSHPPAVASDLAHTQGASSEEHTIVPFIAVAQAQPEQPVEALLHSLKTALSNHPTAAHFIITPEGQIEAQTTLPLHIISPARGKGTMAALRTRLQAAGLSALADNQLLRDQDPDNRTLRLGEDPLTLAKLQAIIQLIDPGTSPSSREHEPDPLVTSLDHSIQKGVSYQNQHLAGLTREVTMQHQNRAQEIDKKRAGYEEELKEPSLTPERREELTTLITLLQRAADYQNTMVGRLLGSRKQNQTRILQENQIASTQEREPRSLETFDPIYLDQLEKINAGPNRIERRIEQLEAAYQRRALSLQREADIAAAMRAFERTHPPQEGQQPVELPDALVQAREEIQASLHANNDLIPLLIEDAHQTRLPHEADPTEATLQEETNRQYAIIRSEGLTRALSLSAGLRLSSYQLLSGAFTDIIRRRFKSEVQHPGLKS